MRRDEWKYYNVRDLIPESDTVLSCENFFIINGDNPVF